MEGTETHLVVADTADTQGKSVAARSFRADQPVGGADDAIVDSDDAVGDAEHLWWDRQSVLQRHAARRHTGLDYQP